MDLVEIDPELFMTCRLCQQEKGKFQIVPAMQIQIKFVYDVTVEPFDGFSQLICSKCRTKVSELCSDKRDMQLKQQQMKNRKSHKEPEIYDIIDTEKDPLPPIEIVKPQSVDASPENTQDLPSESNSNNALPRDSSFKFPKVKASEFIKNYKITYKCRYCAMTFKKTRGVKKHVWHFHKTVSEAKRNLTPHNCYIQLDRWDEKTNEAEDEALVMFDSETMLPSECIDEDNYFWIYKRKIQPNDSEVCKIAEESPSDNADLGIRPSRLVALSKIHDSTLLEEEFKDESRSNTEDCQRRKKKRRLRISSSSSNSDVAFVSDSTSSSKPNPVKKSPIKDKAKHSSTSTEKLEPKPKTRKVMIPLFMAAIQQAYKEEETPKDEETLLNTKLLSMGRKIVRTGPPCIGLLKYVEKKSLALKWMHPTYTDNKGLPMLKEGYVFISPRPMPLDEDNPLENFIPVMPNKNCPRCPLGEDLDLVTQNALRIPKTEFKNIKQLVAPTQSNAETQKLGSIISNNENKPKKPDPIPNIVKAQVSLLQSVKESGMRTLELTPVTMATINRVQQPSKLTIPVPTIPDLPPTINIEPINQATLLNKNPATNPKPPKQKHKVREKSASDGLSYEVPEMSIICIEDGGDSNFEVPMPIITSTKSLAPPEEEKQTQDIENKKPPEPARIKCKPVHELMGPKTIQGSSLLKPQQMEIDPKALYGSPIKIPEDNQNAEKTTNNPGTSNKIPILKSPTQPGVPQLPIIIPRSSLLNNTTNRSPDQTVHSSIAKKGTMVLSTPLLPNTQTRNPFKYFRKLLSLHNVSLIDSSQAPSTMQCLVNFKLGVHQPPVSTMLCLSFHAHGTQSFCIMATSKQEDSEKLVNENFMIAGWQWEVLKAFKNTSVMYKIIDSCRRISPLLLKNCQIFFDLLNSIQVISSMSGAIYN